MKKKNFAEMLKALKNTNFSLPHNVKSQRKLLPNGTCSYVFRHDELGELGRILIVPHGTQSQKSQICCEVVGDPDDPMMEKRKAIFEPISKKLVGEMNTICGNGEGTPGPYISPREEQSIAVKHYSCDVCGALAAMIVFVSYADTKADLEDLARIVHAKVKEELNVPTWIVGGETENIVNGEDLRKALVLKVHPKREEARIMTPDSLMDTVDKLMETHCNG